MKPLNLDERGVFTFCGSGDFFVETDLFSDVDRNFIFSDVSYGGVGDGNGVSTIRPYYGTLQNWVSEQDWKVTHPKGQHSIKDFCGESVKILKS